MSDITDLAQFVFDGITARETAAVLAGNLAMWCDEIGRVQIRHPDGRRIDLGEPGASADNLRARWLAHAALNLPGRVLAECQAQRRIAERSLISGRRWVLESLAQPLADRSGFRAEWRP